MQNAIETNLELLKIDSPPLSELQSQRDWEKLLGQIALRIDPTLDFILAKNPKLLYFKVFDGFLPNQIRKSDFDSFRNGRFERLLLAITTKLVENATRANEQIEEQLKFLDCKDSLKDSADLHHQIQYELDLINQIEQRTLNLVKTIDELQFYIRQNNTTTDRVILLQLQDELDRKEAELFKKRELYNQSFGDILRILGQLKPCKFTEPLTCVASKYGTFVSIMDGVSFFEDGKLNLGLYLDSCLHHLGKM